MDFEKALNELIELAKTNDNLLKVDDLLKYCETDSEEYDKLEKELTQMGIDIVTDTNISNDSLSTDEPDMKALAEEEPIDVEKFDVLPPTIKVDDPVRMYLKEIGKVPLIDAETETKLAKIVVAGNAAQKKLDSGNLNGEDIENWLNKLKKLKVLEKN